jgi:hypothetical protein
MNAPWRIFLRRGAMGATKQHQLEEMEKEAARMDAEAKAAGFEDYAEYEAYLEAMEEER